MFDNVSYAVFIDELKCGCEDSSRRWEHGKDAVAGAEAVLCYLALLNWLPFKLIPAPFGQSPPFCPGHEIPALAGMPINWRLSLIFDIILVTHSLMSVIRTALCKTPIEELVTNGNCPKE